MLREISALKTISHPNINELIHISYNSLKLYLIFPYIEVSLEDILYLHNDFETVVKTPSIEKIYTIKFLYQLLDAISYCHDRRIVHRNIKVC